mmetsp:Transcript_2437/g.8161  ORF Transcript_2437/g.8161 Transcript_2437/m.8161 type:complete len:235 (-) Transcript_2437:18-722(-)
MAPACCCCGALTVLLFAAAASEEAAFPVDDDACRPGDGDCALALRQLRGERRSVAAGAHQQPHGPRPRGAESLARRPRDPLRPILLHTAEPVTAVPLAGCIQDFVPLPNNYMFTKGPLCATGPCGFHGDMTQCQCGADKETTCRVHRSWTQIHTEDAGTMTGFQAIQVPAETFWVMSGWTPLGREAQVIKGFRAKLKWENEQWLEQVTTWFIPGNDEYISFVGNSTVWAWSWFN